MSKVISPVPYNTLRGLEPYKPLPKSAVAKDSGRNPAQGQGTFTEKDFTGALANLRNHLLEFRPRSQAEKQGNPQELSTENRAIEISRLLEELDKTVASSTDPQTIYFGSQLTLLLPFRGIIWKIRALYEEEHDKATQSAMVSGLRLAASVLGDTIPVGQGEVLLDYLSVPASTDGKDIGQVGISGAHFRTVGQLQTFLEAVVAKRVFQTIARIQKIHDSDLTAPLVFDHLILTGPGTLRDGNQRFRGHAKAEVAATLASLHRTLAQIHSFCAYNQDELFKKNEKMARLFGVAGFIPFRELGVSAEDWVHEFNKGIDDSPFLTLYTEVSPTPDELLKLDPSLPKNMEDGKMFMRLAYEHSKFAANYAAEATSAQDRSYLPGMLLNPALMNPLTPSAITAVGTNVTTASEAATALQEALVNPAKKGTVQFREPMTGKVLEFNLRAWYENPPSNLRRMLPTEFEQGPKHFDVRGFGNKKLEVRNYYRGRPFAWKNEVWNPYIIGLGSDKQEMGRVLKGMGEVLAGAGIGLPFVFHVY